MRNMSPTDYEYIRIRIQRGARTGGPNTTVSFSIKQWRKWVKVIGDYHLRQLVVKVGLDLLEAGTPGKLSPAVRARVSEILGVK